MKDNIPSYKEIQENWPQGVDYSQYYVRMIRKKLKEKNPGWLRYNSRSGFLRLYIRDTLLKFTPCTQEFECEKQTVFMVGFNGYRIPHKTFPKGCFVNYCGGGFRNIRKIIEEE